MTKATQNGSLIPIDKCWIHIPNAGQITLNNLPDLADSKQAIYNNEAIIGRSIPLYTFSHSGDRQINMTIHFFVVNEGDPETNLMYLRWIQSAVYPREGLTTGEPYQPPVVCTVSCGNLLATDGPLCVILQSYSVKFPTEVAWDETTFCPYRFDVETSWLVVYSSEELGNVNQSRIIRTGR